MPPPPRQRRVHPALVVIGGVAAFFYFGGLLDGGDDFPPTAGIAETPTTTAVEGLFVNVDPGPTSTVEPFDPDDFESTPSTTETSSYFVTPSDLIFEFSPCTGGFLEGSAFTPSGRTFTTLSFTVIFSPRDRSGETTEVPLTLDRLEESDSMAFDLPVPDEIMSMSDCRIAILDVVVDQ